MRTATDRTTVKEHFAEFFAQPVYDGSYHDTRGFRTDASEEASASFAALTNNIIIWTQVHGDVKNAVARAACIQYPNWPELYSCCRDVIRAHGELGSEFWGPLTCAKLMGDAMQLLRGRHKVNVPRWWLPIMSKLRRGE
jgi:hypothetical protein